MTSALSIGLLSISAVFYIAIVFAMYSDVRSLTIPNWTSISIAAAFLPAALMMDLGFVKILMQYGIGIAAFLFGAIFFHFRMFGGGDVKLLAAICIWINPGILPTYLALVAIIGGIVALAILAMAKLPSAALHRVMPWIESAKGKNIQLPYGIAIGAAAITLPYFIAAFPVPWNNFNFF